MPRPRKAVAADAPKVQSGDTAGKLRLYETLYHLNQAFEQILARLRELERFGIRRRVSKKFQVIVEETRAEVNFELVDRLHERELKDWTHFGRLRGMPGKARSAVARDESPKRVNRGIKRNNDRR
jgi:hypothetical protein